MVQLRDRSLAIMKEIDRLCVENGIRYFIGPDTLLYMHRPDAPADNYRMDVMIPSEDIYKFIEAVDRDGDSRYELESMQTNENYLGFTLRYTDSMTTMISYRDGTNVKYKGVPVVIYPMRKRQTGNKIKTINFLERGWESNGYWLTKNEGKKHQAGAKLVRRMIKVRGRKATANSLFNTMVKANSGAMKSDIVSIRQPKRHENLIRLSHFKNPERVNLEGIEVWAPGDAEGFLDECFGLVWREIEILPDIAEVALPNVPYREFIRTCAKEDLDIKDIVELKRKNIFRSLKARPYLRQRDDSVTIAKRSGDRLNLYEAMKPHMDEIKAAYESDDMDTLRELMAEHEERAVFYLQEGLGFCVNELCLNAQVKIFRNTGRASFADKLIELTPKEHYKSIIE